MRHWPIKVSLFINYFVFAILLNSVGIVILQVQNTYNYYWHLDEVHNRVYRFVVIRATEPPPTLSIQNSTGED